MPEGCQYWYAYGNPLKYTDPSGEFFGLIFRGLSFAAEFASNLIHGKNDPLGSAWKMSGKATNEVGNCTQIPIYKNDNTIVSVGLNPFALGVSLNTTYMENGHTVSSSIGFGLSSGFHANTGYSYTTDKGWSFGGGIGAGRNHWGWNTSATYKDFGLGYGQTYYGKNPGPDGLPHAQTVGGVALLFPGGSFRIENDVFLPKSMREDRWRSSAWELTIGDFSLGSYVYTNDPKNQYGKGDVTIPGNSPTWGPNTDGWGEWKNGQVYSAPLWLGYRVGNSVSRVGFSHWRVQDITQNGIHRYFPFGRQNYYTGYGNFQSSGYGYSGYYNPFSLYY